MKRLKLIAVIIIFIGFCSFKFSDGPDKNKIILENIIQILNVGHFNPAIVNDNFSEKVFKLYIKNLDNGKRFLVKSDVDELKKYEYLIDDQIKKGSFEFFNLSVKLLDNRTNEMKDFYKELLSKPFDFNLEETINMDYENLSNSKDLSDLKESWRKWIKYQVLVKIDDALDVQEKAIKDKDTTLKKVKTFEEIESDARGKVLKTNNDWFKRISQVEKIDRIAAYINAMVACYDPHTEYFPPKQKEDFDISMSGKLEGIGATLQEKDGYIKVSNIVPGSPAAKTGKLKAGDLIIKVAQGESEPVDVVDMRLDNAVKLIRGKKGTEVRLTLKKIDGSIEILPIIRDVIVIEEGYAKSAILKDDKENGVIGYIKLPQFYADFANRNGRRSFTDIKNEIEKLNRENVKGLILDLRFNGGGSLQDVVDMAGLFIKNGPIVQVKGNTGLPSVLSDNDPAIQFDKPLVVLVNSFSASASEIFAAAMQDYKRGVILGSTSTYGKGTVQRFVDLDEYLAMADDTLKPLGSIKLTIQKFYRINGGSTQLKGVTPDIILPDIYNYLKVGESEMDYPMQWSQVNAVNYNVWNSTINFSDIKQKSKARTDKSEIMNLINENALRLEKLDKDKIASLNLNKYRKEQTKLKEESKKYENVDKEIPQLTALSLNSDEEEMKSDTIKQSKAKTWLKDIKKDAYIYEAVKVIEDIK